MDTRTQEGMMVAERATCSACATTESLYILGTVFLCSGCLASAVSMAANDIWPDWVSYKREFERVLM